MKRQQCVLITIFTLIMLLLLSVTTFSQPKAYDLSPDPGYAKWYEEKGAGTWYKKADGSVMRVNVDGTKYYKGRDGKESCTDSEGFHIEYATGGNAVVDNLSGQRYMLTPQGQVYTLGNDGKYLQVYRGCDYTANGINMYTGEYNRAYDTRLAFAAADPFGNGSAAQMASDIFMDKDLKNSDWCMAVNRFYAVKYPNFDFAQEVQSVNFTDSQYRALEDQAIYGSGMPDKVLEYVTTMAFDIPTACEVYRLVKGSPKEKQVIQQNWAKRYDLIMKYAPIMQNQSDKWTAMILPDWEGRKSTAFQAVDLKNTWYAPESAVFIAAFDRFLKSSNLSRDAIAYIKITGSARTIAEYYAWLTGTARDRDIVQQYCRKTLAMKNQAMAWSEYVRDKVKRRADVYRDMATKSGNYALAAMWATITVR